MAPAAPLDQGRPSVQSVLALVLGGYLVSIGATAAGERQLGRHEGLTASVPGDFACTEQATVTVRAQDPAAFAGDRVALQKLLGGLRIMLGFECPNLQLLVLVGEIAGQQVYRGTASANNGWVLADLETIEANLDEGQAAFERTATPGAADTRDDDQGRPETAATVGAEAIAHASPAAIDQSEDGSGGAEVESVLPAELPITSQATPSERRVALVIGNGAYGSEIGALANPSNDAADIAEALEAAGFETMLKLDVDRDAMQRAVIDFGRSLDDGGVGLFYYAGHAVQVDGNNYMIPLGAQIDREDYVPLEAVDINQVLGRMGGANNRLNIVILDACRNNPFRSISRGVSRGLAQTSAPTGTYIAYSAGPGQVALDGERRNSPYTAGLLEMMAQPGLSLEEVFKGVRVKVLASTEDKQTPWTSSSITGDFYFHQREPEVAEPLPTAPPATSDDLVVWSAIANSQNAEDFKMFLETYPDSPLAPFAKQRLARLQ
jgi:uncharacterized caspase-like protein